MITISSKSRVGILLVLAAVSAGMPAAQETTTEKPDARQIMRESLSHWRRNLDAVKNYTYQRRTVEEQLDRDGGVKKTDINTYDISIIYGGPYSKLIAKNDQPLSEKDQKKEQEKLDKFFDNQQKRSEEDRERERKKKLDKFQREIADELPRMLNWELVGEEEFDGAPAWVLKATPNPDYKPNSMAGKLLSKLSGRVWITKSEGQWVKAEADLADDFTVGWFLFKLHKGTHLEFEQTRANDEVWLPKRGFVNGSGRIAVKSARFRNLTEYSNYKKFSAESKITGVAEEPATPQK